MKNNKGMTIVEIIVSIALISIILVFLINLLITVKNANDRNKASSELLINQALITKTIENDFTELKLKGVSYCTQTEVNNNITTTKENVYCLKLIYENNTNGFLLMYTYQYSNVDKKTIVGYKRGNTQVMRETTNISDEKGTVNSSCPRKEYSKCSLKIELPIMGNDTNYYNISLSYIYDSNRFTYTTGNKYQFNIT